MPRPKPEDFNTEGWTDSDWMEFGHAFEPLPDGISQEAADAIYDFKADEAFLRPLDEMASEVEVQFRSSFPEFDKVAQWFEAQLAKGVTQDKLDNLYALYVGHVVMTEFGDLGAGWTLDPRPEQPTYLKPVIGPFPGKPMKYFNPSEYVVDKWLDDMQINTFRACDEPRRWVSDAIDGMLSSPLETHFYRKMHNILPEF